jgi:hypothetical protein
MFQAWGDRGVTVEDMYRGLAAKDRFKKSIVGMVGSQNNKTIKNDLGRWKLIGDAPYLFKNYQHHADSRFEIRREIPPEGIQRIKEIAIANRKGIDRYEIETRQRL